MRKKAHWPAIDGLDPTLVREAARDEPGGRYAWPLAGNHKDNTPPTTSSATLQPSAAPNACAWAASPCPFPSTLKKTPPMTATPSAAPIWKVEMTIPEASP